MAFLEPELTNEIAWVKIDGNHGITFVPAADVNGDIAHMQPERQVETVRDYYEGTAESVEIVSGFGARLSAPGYLDCTDWSVFDTEAEAREYLDGETEDDEGCDECMTFPCSCEAEDEIG